MTDLRADDLFHLIPPPAWAEAQAVGEVAPPSLASEGFVHCSTGLQVPATIERHYPDHDELVLLRLDPDSVADAMRWEEGRPGEVFPHVYRALRPEDIAAVVTWRRGEAARG